LSDTAYFTVQEKLKKKRKKGEVRGNGFVQAPAYRSRRVIGGRGGTSIKAFVLITSHAIIREGGGEEEKRRGISGQTHITLPKSSQIDV